ncbi:MAG: HAMP domain-containing histidine kinase [Candidatus Pristimantibacillus lignocellulolyticus]|uniref:histidine kinase n=1 Tax=Candidatus Pristimantibacillus lignocellulolyticus TaxID=2994561 RepID=A0A9J6ZJP1_9BACL|nr:MAG: HAMP domain-containing histidine kinase [Candidatus Pristimantibacillus lignocellulolyticus]
MKTLNVLKHILMQIFFFSLIIASFSIAYLLVQQIQIEMSDYVRFVAMTITGIFVMFILSGIIHLFTRNKHRYIYQEINVALRKVASGDFNVSLDFSVNQRSELTQLVDHFNHMTKQLQQMEDLRQEFISNVSHEIQSPLTSIVGFAQALQHNNLSTEESSHYLNIIETESRRLSKLSDNLMKLTSLESDQHPFEKKHYFLNQQIKSIILACEPNWTQKNLVLDISLDKVSIIADEDLMSQVWTNIIHNSIKFTPSDGTITISLRQAEEQAIILITDTGIGIAKQDQLHIFERFYKADHARERSKGGNGLGLSIVKKIVEMHGGTITVESELGKGTTSTITLPIS